MACSDPRCEEPGKGSWYCRECGGLTHEGCACSCQLQECPECGHIFEEDE